MCDKDPFAPEDSGFVACYCKDGAKVRVGGRPHPLRSSVPPSGKDGCVSQPGTSAPLPLLDGWLRRRWLPPWTRVASARHASVWWHPLANTAVALT